jgi:hypothetical protein
LEKSLIFHHTESGLINKVKATLKPYELDRYEELLYMVSFQFKPFEVLKKEKIAKAREQELYQQRYYYEKKVAVLASTTTQNLT